MKNRYQPDPEKSVKPNPPKSGSDVKKKIKITKVELHLVESNAIVAKWDITDWDCNERVIEII